MPFSFTWLMAARFLRQKRSIGFITLVSYFSILGLVLGVASLVTTLSILNGFEQTLENKIISFESPIRVRAYHREDIALTQDLLNTIRSVRECQAAHPYVEKEVLFRAGDVSEGVMVRGIEEAAADGSRILRTIVEGSTRLNPSGESSGRGIIVGQDLVNRMEVNIGQRVFLINPQSISGVMTQPLVKPFVVTGIFNTGLYEYDNAFIFISLEAAQELFRMAGMISGFEILIENPSRADEITSLLDQKLSYPLFAQSWRDLHRTLFAWMHTQRLPILIIFGLIIVVGIFNLVSTLIMIVLDKRKAIGILRATGMSARQAVAIFFYQGVTIGIIGVGIGTLLGFGLCWLQDTYELYSLNKDIYFVSSLPVSMQPLDFIVVGGGALLICFLATLYPAYRAAKMLPTDAIRFE